MERRDRHRIPCELQDGGHPDDPEIEFVVSEEVESDAPPEAGTDTAVEAVVPEISEESPPEAAEPIGEDPTPDATEPADPEDPEPPGALQRSDALLIDDGELDDVYEALLALGADPIRHRAVGTVGFGDWEKPPRIVVVSARSAARVTVETANAPRVVKIAVAEADSRTLGRMLRRQGFDYVVHRPVHPEALRLLLMRALYRGWERRSEPRHPLGCGVTTRWAIRWHPATLLEISSGGCSYLGQERLEEGTRVWVRIPRNASSGRSLKLRGKVLRSERRRGEPSKASTVVAVAFDLFWRHTRKRLEALLAAAASGPPALPRDVGQVSPAARGSPPGAGADDPAGATPRAPRLHPRAAYDQEVVVLEAESEGVRQVLFARDLSVGGVRVDPHPDLQLGDRFQLALYNAFFSESIVVDAEVLRDDGERGIVLRFLDTPEHTARKIGRILERGGEIERCDAPGEAHDVTVAEVVPEDRAQPAFHQRIHWWKRVDQIARWSGAHRHWRTSSQSGIVSDSDPSRTRLRMPPGAPRALRCEYQVDPIGLGTRQPRFFWKLDDERPGARQTFYHLLVASDPERLARDEGDLWDSGEQASEENAQLAYRGASLGSRQLAFWKVRSFDAEGEPSDWSAPARFEIGLLDPSDWAARWIASPLAGAPKSSGPVPALRRPFQVEGPIARARLYVTALGLYQSWINGRRVGDQELAPGWTDFATRVRYQVYDVTGHLQEGENAIGALLGDGWYCGFLGLVKARESYGRRPALLAQLEIVHADGSETRIASDERWCWHASPILESDIMQGEIVDARRDLGAWTQPGYDEEAWARVEIAETPAISLDAMSGPPVRAIRELSPVKAPPLRRGHPLFAPRRIFDLGQNMVGRVRLRVRGEEGTTVQLRHAEVLDENGELYTENLRDARATDTFTLRGTGEAETFEPRFTFHGFRYVEVSGRLEEDAIEELTGVVLHSDMPETGAFSCSDADLNQLQSNIVWGQRGNFVDVPTDCPQRDERLGWTGDAQVFVRTASFNMEVAGFFSKWLLDLEDAQAEDGRVPPVAPVTGAGPLPLLDGGPAWADAVVICPWTIHRCFGDRRLLEERWSSMAAYLDFLERRFPNGIRSDPGLDPWGGFGDWVALDGTVRREDRLGGTPKDLIGTAFLSHSARLLAEIAGTIDRPAEEKRYRELSASVRDAFRRRFVTPDGLVAGNTQTSYVLALHFDLLEDHERETSARALAHNIEQHGHLTTGFVGTPYLLHVLTRTGRLDLAYHLLLRREFPSWLFPVVKGDATTIWERWDGWTEEKGFFDPEMNSFNHYAYGAVGDWLYGTVAGLDLDPEVSGWRRARLAPRPPLHPGLPDPPLLSSARAELETIHGGYAVEWSIEGERFRFDAQVPAGCSARVELPDGSTDEVKAGRHRFEIDLDAAKR